MRRVCSIALIAMVLLAAGSAPSPSFGQPRTPPDPRYRGYPCFGYTCTWRPPVPGQPPAPPGTSWYSPFPQGDQDILRGGD